MLREEKCPAGKGQIQVWDMGLTPKPQSGFCPPRRTCWSAPGLGCLSCVCTCRLTSTKFRINSSPGRGFREPETADPMTQELVSHILSSDAGSELGGSSLGLLRSTAWIPIQPSFKNRTSEWLWPNFKIFPHPLVGTTNVPAIESHCQDWME